MQFLGTIRNGSVLLDSPSELPDGTRVLMLRSCEWFPIDDELHIADLKGVFKNRNPATPDTPSQKLCP